MHSRATEGKKGEKWAKKGNFLANGKSLNHFNNGQDAIDGLNEMTEEGKNLPSVIFLDLNMPIMNGWEFLEDFVKITEPQPRESHRIYYQFFCGPT